jgi:hypothetical protein
LGERDETKFIDARHSAETELPYGSNLSSATLLGLDDFLIDLGPGRLRPGRGFFLEAARPGLTATIVA